MHDLVGRTGELDRLVAATTAGTHSALRGEPGMGKSRLLGELALRLATEGLDLEWIYASAPDVAVPFAPFAHLLADDLPVLESTDLMARVMARLAARCEERPTCVLVDDAHRLDPGSIELLHQAMNQLPISVVIASRTGPGTDPRVRSAVAAADGPEVLLGPLLPAESAELLTQVLRGPLDDRIHDEVHRLSSGNPFVVIELAAAGTSSGAIRQDETGRWRLERRLAAPPRVHDLILERLRPLDDAAMQVLRMLAVTGGLPLATLLTQVGVDRLAQLEQFGLVSLATRSTDRSIVLEHDLYREVLLDAPSLLLDDAREQAVLAIDACGQDDDGLDLLAARLSMESGRPEPERHLRASLIALRAWDGALALDLATAAEAAGAGQRATLARATALGLLGRSAEAADLFAVLEQSTDLDLTAEVICGRAVHLMSRDADPAAAVALLRSGLERCGPPHDAPVRAALAGTLFFTGRIDEAVAAAEPLVDASGRFPVNAAPALLGGWAVMGQPAEVLRAAGHVWSELANGTDEQAYVGVNMVFCRLLALLQLGRLPEGDDPTSGVPIRCDWPGRRSWVVREAMPATQQYLRGHLGDAAESYGRVDRLLRSSPSQIRVMNEAIEATLHAQRGDPVEARRMLDSIATVPPGALVVFEWWIGRARVWLAAAEGSVAGAVAQSRALVERHAGQHFYVTTSLHDIVRLGCSDLVVEELAAMAGRDGATWLDHVCAEHARAAVRHDAEALLRVSARFEEGGLDLAALECAGQAAAAAGADGQVARSAEAAVQVERLGRVCGPVRTPALVTEEAALTGRELEVARLAGQGLSNADIGLRLGTSRRTVGNQLQRVYEKLGIHGRDQL